MKNNGLNGNRPQLSEAALHYKLRKTVAKLLDALHTLEHQEPAFLNFKIGQVELLMLTETEQLGLRLKGLIQTVCEQLGCFIAGSCSAQGIQLLKAELEHLLSQAGGAPLLFSAELKDLTPKRSATGEFRMLSHRMAQASLSTSRETERRLTKGR